MTNEEMAHPVAAGRPPAGGSAAPCPSCGTTPRGDAGGYVYALGNVEVRFPSLAVEKEMAQALGRAETTNLTDHQALHAVLSEPHNRYLARQLCWVLTIQGLDAYVLRPRDSSDGGLLVDALRPIPGPGDKDVVIGMSAGMAPPHLCNGLQIPVVLFDQIYSFDRESFVSSVPRPDDLPEKEYRAAAATVYDRILQMTGNMGASARHRALNYVVARYAGVYANAAQMFSRNFSLASVDLRHSDLSGARDVVEVILTYTHRKNDATEKFFARVDATEEFPFLVSKVAPYFDH